MKILVVTATKPEIQPLLLAIGSDGKGVCTYKGLQVEILITGVGMTSTAFHLGKTLTSQYDFALNFGIAGSFNRNLELGSVVNIVKDTFSEMGAESGNDFIPISEMNMGVKNEILNNTITANKPINLLPKVFGITVNTVHGKEESIQNVFNQFHPFTESMEGAAFLMACEAQGIACAQIRAISNYVELRNRDAWNIPLAITNLNNKALEILHDFGSR